MNYYFQFDTKTNMAIMSIKTDIPYDPLPENVYEVSQSLFDMPIGQICLVNQTPVFIETPKPYPWDKWDASQQRWVDGRDVDEWKQNIKNERNAKLYECDWTQIPNNPLTTEKQQEWADYRQQLRDITSQSGYPLNVVWPTQPE